MTRRFQVRKVGPRHAVVGALALAALVAPILVVTQLGVRPPPATAVARLVTQSYAGQGWARPRVPPSASASSPGAGVGQVKAGPVAPASKSNPPGRSNVGPVGPNTDAICGTWSLIEASSATQLGQDAAVAASLATPGLAGLSVRVPWTAITSNLSVLDAGYTLAQASHVGYAVRFMAGVSTPAQFLGNATSLAGGGRIPLPWGPGSTPSQFVPNTVFENAFNATVAQLAAYSRAHGIRELHLPWYGGQFAELYLGPETQAAPGYSYQNFLTGHERLLQIAMRYSGSDLAVEFPFTGIGTQQVDGDLAQYILATWGQWNPDLVTQANNLSDSSAQSTGGGWAIYNGRQMFGMGDYNWTNVYQALLNKQSLSVEIYAASFDPSLAHARQLRSEIQSFAAQCP